jgi:hypothetical protein
MSLKLGRLILGLLIVTLLGCAGSTPTPAGTTISVATTPLAGATTLPASAATSEAIPASASPTALPGLTRDTCLSHTRDEPACKDCCDSLDVNARKSCRDECAVHDFGQNTDIVTVTVASVLGPQGDYSFCTSSDDEQGCKVCCDGSTELQAGDRRFCRDACSAKFGAAQPAGDAQPKGRTLPGGGSLPAGPGKQPPPPNPAAPKPQNTGPQGQAGQAAPKPQNTGPQGQAGQAAMNIEQAISDEAQAKTIAFDALAFLTGDLGADSFFPPGKVADFWGFQYLRDNDPSQMGHNTDFLTHASLNMLSILTPEQRATLVTLAKSQVDAINEYGYNRFVLMDAFRRLLEGDLPAGSTGLSRDAVEAYSAELYRLDGEISYERAQVMGRLLSSLDDTQQAALDALVGKGMLDWPDAEEPADLAGLDRDTKVAVMTYAGDMFSWYAGSVEADVYFCPERQGTYFGSFYLKDGKAMGNPDYTISSTLTGDMGQALLEALTAGQAQLVTGLVDAQKPALQEIVERRQDVATLLRQFMAGETPDRDQVLRLMERYGELDGEIIYRYAVAFTQVSASLTDEQRAQLMALRTEILGEDMLHPAGAYLYSQPISMPDIADTDFLFAAQ